MNTVLILGGCLAVLLTMLGAIWIDRPVDDEHSLDASRRRHPSSRVPTHVRRVDRPYDQDRDP